MSSEVAFFWKQELMLNDARLSWLDGHINALKDQFKIAATRPELQVAIQRELDYSLVERERVQGRGHTLRLSLSLRVLQSFPAEILRQIFLAVLIEPDSMLDTRPCLRRVKAPFIISAVCSRWRQLALQIPHLWAYIYLRPHRNRKTIPAASYDLVLLLLERSQRVPLVIHLPWSSDTQKDWKPDSLSDEGRVLGLLMAESRRWRSIEFDVAEGALTVSSMSLFRCVTPVLEHCEVIGPWPDESLPWTGSFPNFLPVCPSLRSFRSEWTNITPMRRPRDNSCSSLVTLTLRVSIPCSDVWDILRRAAPQLEQLDLGFALDPTDSDHIIRAPIAFARLNDLRFSPSAGGMFCANGALLSFPVLRTLEIRSTGLASLHRLWENKRLDIEQLILFDVKFTDDDAAELALFTRVSRLELEDCSPTEPFFSALTSPLPDGTWVLPALDVLAFAEGASVEGQDGDSLIRLVQARNDAHRDGGPHHPHALRISVDEESTVTSWAMDQIDYILEGGLV